jgi:hypothetical protein
VRPTMQQPGSSQAAARQQPGSSQAANGLGIAVVRPATRQMRRLFVVVHSGWAPASCRLGSPTVACRGGRCPVANKQT